MKRLLLIPLLTTLAVCAYATADFSNGKRYHIVCTMFAEGCVTDGASTGQNTPLYYLESATTGEETYWLFTEEEEGLFSIKNVKTGQYVTYDGVREDIADTGRLRRYVSMTDGKDDPYSLWTFAQQSEGVYTIRNAGKTDHIWDVRTDSRCVGTYSNNNGGNQNQRFSFYDDNGNLVKEKAVQPVTTSGFNVSSWLVATTESPDGWTFEGDAFTDPGFGNYRNGAASVVSPFLERWNDSSWGPLPENAMYQTLQNLPPGKYQLTADIIAVRQSYNNWWGESGSEEVGRGVYLYAYNFVDDEVSTEAGTRNERPQHYITDFTVGNSGKVEIGLHIDSETNANWVATDNFTLYFLGTQQELTDGEKQKVRAELAEWYNAAEVEKMVAACGDDFEKLESLRHSVALLPKADPLAKVLKNISIDGRTLAYAKSVSLYLATTDEKNFDTDYTATIAYDRSDGWGDLMINGTKVPSGSAYTFKNMRAGTNYVFAVSKTDGTGTERHNITFTALPVVKITGSFNNEYKDGYIQVIEPTMATLAEMLNMKAKWRGGITNSNGKHKRNYHVKLKDAEGNKLERSFFGLRNDNSWILESCQVDMSRIRNRVLTDLWNDYATPPYYIGQEKKAMTGTRGQFVELILNDEYRGIYCMTENMDRKQMKLKKYDETVQETHGQLWKSKDWSYAVLMGTRPDGGYTPKDYLSDPNANSEMWDRYQVKYPDFEDYGYQTDWSTLYDAVDFVCHSTDDEFRQNFKQYFDLPVVIDYYILMECILSTDNHGKNMFFACYDQQEDKKITLGVWDMDATCGQRWSDQYYHWNGMQPEQDYATFIARNEHGDYNLFKRLRDTDAEDFNMQVRLRYRDLRENHLNTESILQRFSNYLEHFKHCGAAQREYNKWNGDSDINGLSLDFDNEMNYLTDWFTRRMNYLDTQRFDIGSLPSGINSLTLQEQVSKVYNLSGQQVGTTRQLKQLPAGIYIVNGKKVAVK